MTGNNLTPPFQADLVGFCSHRNTLNWCCTSFENSGGPKTEPVTAGNRGASLAAAPLEEALSFCNLGSRSLTRHAAP